jgi:hypothetical protein
LPKRSPIDNDRPSKNSIKRRFSSAVEQRFCKPKVGSSILSTGTTHSDHLGEIDGGRDGLPEIALFVSPAANARSACLSA